MRAWCKCGYVFGRMFGLVRRVDGAGSKECGREDYGEVYPNGSVDEVKVTEAVVARELRACTTPKAMGVDFAIPWEGWEELRSSAAVLCKPKFTGTAGEKPRRSLCTADAS